MAEFSRLPNEIISEIWGNIHEPEDVESFALVSKHVYAIGRPFVKEHNKLKKDFRYIEIDSEACASGPASLLKEVLLRPRIALYVTHLCIGGFRSEWDERDDGDEWPYNAHVPYPDNVMALFIETIRKSSFVPRNETSGWITSVNAGDEDPIVALLCMLLPNLNKVTLIDDGFDGEISQETILRIAKAEKTLFLTRLVTVNIVCGSYERERVFDWLRTFAALPSVQYLDIDEMGMDKVHDLIDNAQCFVSDSYSIRELTFTNCGLHPKILAQLLDSVKGLKVFSYSYPEARSCKSNPFWIRTALLANAKHSLEYLEIHPPMTGQAEVLGSLRGFTALKELKTHVRLLYGESGLDGFANLLPSSIEKIYLDACYYVTDDIVPRIVEEIVKAKSRLIPHLEALKLATTFSNRTIGGYRSIMEPLEEKCQNVGIELTFIGPKQKDRFKRRIGC